MKKLRVTVDIEIDEESCKEHGVGLRDVLNRIVSFPDDALDGIVIMQKATDEIVLGYPTLKSKRIIETDKKSNMEYWDGIDDSCEEFVKKLLSHSIPETELGDDTILYVQNEIRDFAVELLERETTARFPYVDENY